MPNNNEKGKIGEEIAITHLLNNGLAIVEVNWRYKHLEVDIIAQNNKTLVFVEVKLRASNEYGEPEKFVTLSKQRHLIKAANAYIIEKELDYDIRFDVISIIKNTGTLSVEHIIDAFYPTLK